MSENHDSVFALKMVGPNTTNTHSNTASNDHNNNGLMSNTDTTSNIDSDFSSMMMNSTEYMDTNHSYTALSIHNNPPSRRKALAPVSSASVDNRNAILTNQNSSNANTQQDALHHARNPISLDCSSFIENSSSYIATPNASSATTSAFGKNHKFLSDLYSTPESKIFDSQDSELDTPITPISPHFYSPKNQLGSAASANHCIRYPLKDSELEKFVLSPEVFHLQLDDKIGKGSNAFVYACRLSTIGIENSSFDVAVKIPITKNKVKYIIQETRFALKLRSYQDKWFKTNNRFYPFIDCYGLYYMNRDQFPQFNRTDELPCLLMKKMTVGLSTYIQSEAPQSCDNTKLPLHLWWNLCRTLLDALTVLKSLQCVHCDLKTDNIMMLQTDDGTEDFLFKVIDFSSACEVDKLTKCPDMTLQYTAPELLDFTKKPLPTFQSDLFSAGLVLLEASTGSRPYHSAGYDHFYLLTVIKEGKVLEWISPEDANVLKANPGVASVLRRILVERAPLEDVCSYVEALHGSL